MDRKALINLRKTLQYTEQDVALSNLTDNQKIIVFGAWEITDRNQNFTSISWDKLQFEDDGFATTHKFTVDAVAGTDKLVQAASDDQDMYLVVGLTGLEVTAGTAKSYTKMAAAQLRNVRFTGNIYW